MRECGDCNGTGRLGWDVTPGRRKAKVTCKKCAGTGWHFREVFKPEVEIIGGHTIRPLKLKALAFLLLRMVIGGFKWGESLLKRWFK